MIRSYHHTSYDHKSLPGTLASLSPCLLVFFLSSSSLLVFLCPLSILLSLSPPRIALSSCRDLCHDLSPLPFNQPKVREAVSEKLYRSYLPSCTSSHRLAAWLSLLVILVVDIKSLFNLGNLTFLLSPILIFATLSTTQSTTSCFLLPASCFLLLASVFHLPVEPK